MWKHKPKDGYGYVLHIPVKIEKILSKQEIVIKLIETGKVIKIDPKDLDSKWPFYKYSMLDD